MRVSVAAQALPVVAVSPDHGHFSGAERWKWGRSGWNARKYEVKEPTIQQHTVTSVGVIE